MRVQRPSGSDDQSWTVVRADYRVVEPIEAFLAHLSALDRSPNTVNAYAFDLRDFFVFLDGRRTAWERATAEDVAPFAGWLRLPPDADSETVVALPASDSRRSPATIRRKLAAVSSFYDFHQRRGVDVSASLTATRSTWFSGAPVGPVPVAPWPPAGPGPRDPGEGAQADPERLDPGAGVGGTGGVRAAAGPAVLHSAGDAGLRRAKPWGCGTKTSTARAAGVRPAPPQRQRRPGQEPDRAAGAGPGRPDPPVLGLLHEQYGDLDSDYVFVNPAGPAAGRAWRYASAHDLVGRLRRRSGVPFTPHAFRHTYATELQAAGVAVEVVQTLLGHSSVTTTSLAREHGNVSGSIPFGDIQQPWLRDLAKRYLRMRLIAGLNVTSVNRHRQCIAMLAGFIHEQAPGNRSAAVLTRDMLERWMPLLGDSRSHVRTRSAQLWATRAFLIAVRRHGWAPKLPALTEVHPEDFPRRPALNPRLLSEFVMNKLEDPATLARIANPHFRLILQELTTAGT